MPAASDKPPRPQPRSSLASEPPRPRQKKRVRITCIQVPLFPLAARLRVEPELLGEGITVLEGSGQAARVVAATRLARNAGIKAGHTLAQARALLPGLIARARDLECENSAQEALVEVAESFSPRVESHSEGLAWFDASGLEHHHDSEEAMGRAVVHALDAVGLPARVGIAGSKLAARVAASLPRSPHVVAAGEEARFLAPLPLNRLTPESEIANTLELWGIATIGELAALDRSEIASRLGEAGQKLHETARGLDPEPLEPRPPSPVIREGMTLEWPLVDLEPFMFTARAVLERICGRLSQRGLGCLELQLAMRLEPDGWHERSIRLPSPTRDLETLLTLIRLDLEAHPPDAPVASFFFLAHPDAPRSAQLSLLGPPALSPDRLATAVARLFALLGPGRVGSPRLPSGHRPERFELVEYEPPPPPKVRPAYRTGRGLLAVRVLRPPLEIDVHTNKGDGTAKEHGTLEDRPRPVAIERQNLEKNEKRPKIGGRVRVASGPWELEEEWWSEKPAKRDYWDVELDDGSIYRIYRDRLTAKWFVDGLYD